jgi:hypothetical protein
MAYKEKICEQCGAKHTKRGRFCSRTCSDEAGRGRKWTKEQKEAVSLGLQKWHKESDTAAVAAHNFISQGKHKEADPVAPMVYDGPEDGFFVQDGDLWEEC